MKKIGVLVVDDERNTCTGIKYALDDTRYEVDTAENINTGFHIFKLKKPRIVITDLRMEGEDDGFQFLQRIKSEIPETIVLMITAYGDVEKAVCAMQAGAFDFITKPFTADQIEIRVNKAAETLNLVNNNSLLRKELSKQFEMVGNSESMQKLKEQIALIAPSDRPALIFGENGTGKELVARAIQQGSQKSTGPFIQVNCAAIPDSLIEAELFGSKKGSFTFSIENKYGKFELADGGTLFLDEIGDMSLNAQSKVLRAIENNEITPIGAEKSVQVDVRIIAATNKDLAKMVVDGQFREDLYYRLSVLPVMVPSLRDRIEDIPLLVNHFLSCAGANPELFTPEAVETLKTWNWPGNIRELKNIVERAFILGKNKKVDASIVQSFLFNSPSKIKDSIDTNLTLKDARENFERNFIRKVLDECGNNKSRTAERLGLQRSYLHQKLTELGLNNEKD